MTVTTTESLINAGQTTTPSVVPLFALMTIPSVLWTSLRMAGIVRKHHKVIAHHIRYPSHSFTTRTAAVSFLLHILLGMAMLIALPYSAYLCLPPKILFEDDSLTTTSFMSLQEDLPMHWFLLGIMAVILLLLNLSVIFLLPDPYDKEVDQIRLYDCQKGRRELIRCVFIIHCVAWSYSAMVISPLAFYFPPEWHLIRLTFLSVATVIYLFLTATGVYELAPLPPSIKMKATKTNNTTTTTTEATTGHFCGHAWEETVWGRVYFRVLSLLLGSKKNKSRLLLAHTMSSTTTQRGLIAMFLIVNSLAFIQCCAMILSTISSMIISGNEESSSPSPQSHNHSWKMAREEYFVTVNVYVTLVASLGYFVAAQATLDKNTTIEKRRHDFLEKVILTDAFMGLVLPIAAQIIVMSEWVEPMHSVNDFGYYYCLWGS